MQEVGEDPRMAIERMLGKRKIGPAGFSVCICPGNGAKFRAGLEASKHLVETSGGGNAPILIVAEGGKTPSLDHP